MNLALLHPFRRQLPDRVDSTISLPRNFHPQMKEARNKDREDRDQANSTKSKGKRRSLLSAKRKIQPSDVASPRDNENSCLSKDVPICNNEEKAEWVSCLSISFNRRGLYLASGYKSGAVAVFDFMSRTLVALYHPPLTIAKDLNDSIGKKKHKSKGITSLSWSRRSRRLLCGQANSPYVYLVDNAYESSHWPPIASINDNSYNNNCDTFFSSQTISDLAVSNHPSYEVKEQCYAQITIDTDDNKLSSTQLDNDDPPENFYWTVSGSHNEVRGFGEDRTTPTNNNSPAVRRRTVQNLVLKLPVPVGEDGLQSHPFDAHLGLVVGKDGSLFLFRYPYLTLNKEQKWTETCDGNSVQDQDKKGDFFDERKNRTSKKRKKKSSSNSLHVIRNLSWNGWALIFPLVASKEIWQQRQNLFYKKRQSTSMKSDGSNEMNTSEEINDETEDLPKTNLDNDLPPFVIACASFDKKGNYVFAGTQCGHILVFDLSPSCDDKKSSPRIMSPSKPTHNIKISGRTSIRQLVISHNGQTLLLNCTDGILRLYNIDKILHCVQDHSRGQDESHSSNFSTTSVTLSPCMTFQDPMSNKKTWLSVCFSGDDEYVFAGCNTSPDVIGERYDLFIWNTFSGALCDQLMGPEGVSLHGISSHPTRSFLAVCTSDGLIDVWGPRMDWTAFAPDFQAMTNNVEYIEMEDEFDTVIDDVSDNPNLQFMNYDGIRLGTKSDADLHREEDCAVDVVTIEKVPMFDSDSEDEEHVFWFESKAMSLLNSFGKNSEANENKRRRKSQDEEE